MPQQQDLQFFQLFKPKTQHSEACWLTCELCRRYAGIPKLLIFQLYKIVCSFHQNSPAAWCSRAAHLCVHSSNQNLNSLSRNTKAHRTETSADEHRKTKTNSKQLFKLRAIRSTKQLIQSHDNKANRTEEQLMTSHLSNPVDNININIKCTHNALYNSMWTRISSNFLCCQALK